MFWVNVRVMTVLSYINIIAQIHEILMIYKWKETLMSMTKIMTKIVEVVHELKKIKKKKEILFAVRESARFWILNFTFRLSGSIVSQEIYFWSDCRISSP